MNQEDRLKWTELISKDKDAFFSLNKSDYDEDLLSMCLRKGVDIGDIYDKFGVIAYRFVEGVYIDDINEATDSPKIKFLSDKIINAVILKFNEIDKESKSEGIAKYSNIFKISPWHLEDWRSVFVRHNINLIRDYFEENIETIYHTISPDGKPSFIRHAEDDITNEFLSVLIQSPLKKENIDTLMPWVDGMIVEIENKRQRINREFTNNDIVWFRDSAKDFNSFDSYICDIVATISCEIRYNQRNSSEMFGTHKYNKEVLSKAFKLLDSPFLINRYSDIKLLDSPFLINRYSDIKFKHAYADNKQVTHSDVMKAVVKEIMKDSDYEYLIELIKEKDEHVINIMETVDINLGNNHKVRVVDDYSKSETETWLEKYGWIIGIVVSSILAGTAFVIGYNLIF